MEKWVLSMVGIVAVSILLDIIVPEGESNKYIKGVFSIMTICIMIAPLPEIVSSIKNGNVRVPIYKEEIAVDNVFIEDTLEKKYDIIECNLVKILEKSGAKRVSIDISNRDNDEIIDKITILESGLNEYRAKQIVLDAINLEVEEVEVIDGG